MGLFRERGSRCHDDEDAGDCQSCQIHVCPPSGQRRPYSFRTKAVGNNASDCFQAAGISVNTLVLVFDGNFRSMVPLLRPQARTERVWPDTASRGLRDAWREHCRLPACPNRDSVCRRRRRICSSQARRSGGWDAWDDKLHWTVMLTRLHDL
jgi:hypothetical protein